MAEVKPTVEKTAAQPKKADTTIDVSYIGGSVTTSLLFDNVFIEFIDGSATVSNELAGRLKAAKMVK